VTCGQRVRCLGRTRRGSNVLGAAAHDPTPFVRRNSRETMLCRERRNSPRRRDHAPQSTLKFNSRIARLYSSFCLRMIALKFAPHIPTG
jgi:hypothetical protein